MKKIYIPIFIICLICILLFFLNPTKSDYNLFMTNQIVEKGIEPKITQLSEQVDNSILDSIINFGQNISDDFIDTTIEEVIDNATVQSNYYLFSIYDTNIDLIYQEFHFKFIGIGNIFIPLELPE